MRMSGSPSSSRLIPPRVAAASGASTAPVETGSANSRGARGPDHRHRRQVAFLQPPDAVLLGLAAGPPSARAPPRSSRRVATAPEGLVTVTGSTVSARVRRDSTSSPSCRAPDSTSSSSSGSFISQCASRRSSSACGPPPSKPRLQSQAWSEASMRHPALALTVEHQERPRLRALHHRGAAVELDLRHAEPAPPARLAVRARRPRRMRLEARRHRMPRADRADPRGEALLEHPRRSASPAGSRSAASARGCPPRRSPRRIRSAARRPRARSGRCSRNSGSAGCPGACSGRR